MLLSALMTKKAMPGFIRSLKTAARLLILCNYDTFAKKGGAEFHQAIFSVTPCLSPAAMVKGAYLLPRRNG